MFKNRAFLIQCVPTPKNETDAAPLEPLCEFAIADIQRERFEQLTKTAAAGFILFKGVDTLCKIALHTASTKIK